MVRIIALNQRPSKIFHAWFFTIYCSTFCTCQSLSLLSNQHSFRIAIVTRKMFVSCHIFYVCAKRIRIYSKGNRYQSHLIGKGLINFFLFERVTRWFELMYVLWQLQCVRCAIRALLKRDH